MGIKTFRPTTSTLRFKVRLDYKEITKAEPEKSLVTSRHETGGRCSTGRRTVRYRGGGNRTQYRIVDFKRDKKYIHAKIVSIEYDPNRSAFIALVHYEDGEKRYILAPVGAKVGDKIMTYSVKSLELDRTQPEIKIGNALPIFRIPVGTRIHNIELKPGKGGQLARSAGAMAQIVGREDRTTKHTIFSEDGKTIVTQLNVPTVAVRMPSGEIRRILGDCYATVGQVGNLDHSNVVLGKAGANRWVGKRSKVRGIVMNPHDHPHGGG